MRSDFNLLMQYIFFNPVCRWGKADFTLKISVEGRLVIKPCFIGYLNDGKICVCGICQHSHDICNPVFIEQFKKIDRKISLVSGVSKANAVLSALKGGLVDVLILDSNLAEALLKLTQE